MSECSNCAGDDATYPNGCTECNDDLAHCEWCDRTVLAEEVQSDPQDNGRCAACRDGDEYARQKEADYRSMTG